MTSSLNEGGTAVYVALLFMDLSFFLLRTYVEGGIMKTYLVKQKLRLGGERFDIKDDAGHLAYRVEGSFMQLPKQFTIYDDQGRQVSVITKKIIALLPQFTVDLVDHAPIVIQKKLTFFRDKYDIGGLGLEVRGNIWDLDFTLQDKQGKVLAEISKAIFHLTSTYQVRVYEQAYADLVISLCVAIDFVEMMESAR